MGRSVFVKLVAIMVVMAACLLLMVSGFFWYILHQSVGASFEQALGDYAKTIAAASPDLETARRLGARLDLQIRYEGPRGSWSTADTLPSIAEMRTRVADGSGQPAWGRSRYLVAAPDGGTYLFAWKFGPRIGEAHDRFLWMLLATMLGVVFTAHVVLRRALRPLRTLHEGVRRLSEGNLEVVLPNPTRDEFGVLTDAFNHMVGRVKDMLRARDQLLLDVSHELRSPLTRMKVALALLPDGEKKTRMEADVAEMEAMITELLELERLRDGRGIRTERRDLVPILREVAGAFEEGRPGVRVTSSAPELLLDIDGDRVRTVVRNVVENAVKYSLPDSRPVEVSATRNGGTVMVRVTDDGPGIPEADLDRLFEPFFRVDRSRSKKTGGYGLGLSICKRIMEAHGGRIAADNNAGRGAAFTLTFPVAGSSRLPTLYGKGD
jgi:signal transduction histidine kinase